jgi:hypothetical protein
VASSLRHPFIRFLANDFTNGFLSFFVTLALRQLQNGLESLDPNQIFPSSPIKVGSPVLFLYEFFEQPVPQNRSIFRYRDFGRFNHYWRGRCFLWWGRCFLPGFAGDNSENRRGKTEDQNRFS